MAHKLSLALSILVLGAFACSKPSNPSKSVTSGSIDKNDPLLYSFATVGCNRVDKEDVKESNPSTANVIQLNATFQHILSLKVRPKYFFFTGDLVMGYTKEDTALLRKELTAWRFLYEKSGLKEAGVQLVPMPGNHESLASKKKPANLATETIWLDVMKPYIVNNNGPKKGGDDSLQTDQSQLSYSFNDGETHFLILNTDAAGKESSTPNKWIAQDLRIAKANGAKHIFAFAHKPAYSYPGEDGLNLNLTSRNTFWQILEQNDCEAMFAAHNHLYYKTQPNKGKTWQVVAGNGGSPLYEKLTDNKQKMFGYTLVEVYKSGKVITKSYGRDVPSTGYLGSIENTPTSLRDEFEITFGK